MAEENNESYDRGHVAGEIAARLAGHDKHFAAINGSLSDLANEMHLLTLAVQRLGDQAVSRDATVLTTAAALKDAEAARREKGNQSWSPWARIFATVAAVAAALAAIWYVNHLH
jgi:hypothetical protein